jgi:hypothetical protein
MTSPNRTRLRAPRKRRGAAAVADAIGTTLHAWGDAPAVVAEVFGEASPAAITAALDAFCREQLGAGVASLEFFHAGVGSVHGLRLADRRLVVVKAHRPGTSVARLQAVQTVQRKLWADGFPCPEPLLPPAPLGAGVAVVESMLRAGVPTDAHLPDVRAAMARALAVLVSSCRPFAALDALCAGARRTPGPDGVLDVYGAPAGAEWIDELAAEADRVQTSAGEPVLGHRDWRAENVRFTGDELTAVYGWDRLAVVREPVLVGGAAQSFTSDRARDDLPRLPTLDEALAFVEEYEHARDLPFTPEERRAARAALVHAAASAARCEHADRVTGSGGHAPEPWVAPPASATAFLREHGTELLG